VQTPLGLLRVEGTDAGLRSVLFDSRRQPGADATPGALVREAVLQLQAYFAGRLHRFELPLAPRGTPFQRAVWEALRGIPYGEVTDYGTIASRVGRPAAARAVGGANHENPIGIVVPCHRVIGRSGKLVGYAGGVSLKAWLLDHERRHRPKLG
jgi:methylated-DNA-[protein]-cysteine S-methyltransferase